jgi:hypothetical protein
VIRACRERPILSSVYVDNPEPINT